MENLIKKTKEDKSNDLFNLFFNGFSGACSDRKLPSGYIYLIKEMPRGHIKIGCAIKPESRLKTLQTSNPRKLILLRSFPSLNPPRLERLLHKKFKEKRVNGEWFNLSLYDTHRIDTWFSF